MVECELENISLFMKYINSNYAIYVNKTHQRSGHLWQGRFYSRYINSDNYFYILLKYIERNPIEAGMVHDVGEYPYTLVGALKNKTIVIECTQQSKLLDELKEIDVFLQMSLSEKDVDILQTIEKQKTVFKEDSKSLAYTKSLQNHFKNSTKINSRDQAIHEALSDGYTQAQIARHFAVSRARISQIVKG